MVNNDHRVLAQVPEPVCDACVEYRYLVPVGGSGDGGVEDGAVDQGEAGSAGES